MFFPISFLNRIDLLLHGSPDSALDAGILAFACTKQMLKPSQGLVLKSPSNGGNLLKLWQDKKNICYRVRAQCCLSLLPLPFCGRLQGVSQLLVFAMFVHAALLIEVLTQKADDASAYNQGDLVEIPLTKVDAVVPSGEAVPFTLTIEYEGVSTDAHSLNFIITQSRSSKIHTCCAWFQNNFAKSRC